MNPSVLFVCVKNGGKSQMAAALARLAGQDVEVHSAGTHPGNALNEESRASVERIGATMDGEFPKAIEAALLSSVDRVVIIGGEAKVEPVEGMRGTIERWETDEPSLRGIEGAERMDLIRDDLAARVDAMLAELA